MLSPARRERVVAEGPLAVRNEHDREHERQAGAKQEGSVERSHKEIRSRRTLAERRESFRFARERRGALNSEFRETP